MDISYHGKCRSLSIAILTIMLVSACNNNGSGNSGSNEITGTRSGDSYLYLSVPDFYFGTKDVGSTTTQPIQIANRGANVYRLSSMRITGNLDNPDDPDYSPEEFATEVIDNVVLQPAEAVTVGVSFKPITERQKKANFVVDYEALEIAEDAVNINEQLYYLGHEQEKNGQFRAARRSYTDYINNDPVTTNKRRAAVKLPIITESDTYGTGYELTLYLQAVDQRDSGDFDAALSTLDNFDQRFVDSYLADDAMYLTGYIQLMDKQNYQAAMRSMQRLRKQHPDSTYYDTSLYGEAIAQIEIGNTIVAREILTGLRERHTSLEAFGIGLPKDNLVSRLWFERANQLLQTISPV